jgi:hypothetical protein
MFGTPTMTTVGAVAQTQFLSLFLRHFQPLPPPQPQDPRIARWKTFPTQQRGDPPIPKSRTATRKLQHPTHQSRFVAPRLRLVTLTRARLTDHLARPSLGNRELTPELLGRRTLPRRAYQFPSAMCFSIRLSSVSSATTSLSFLFSSSSFFSRIASSAYIPPYWRRQRSSVDSLTSSDCNTNARSFPALNIASASRNFRTICSGE